MSFIITHYITIWVLLTITGNSSSYETTEERTQKAKKLELQCLSELSLKQLKIWIEEDEDKKTSKVCLFLWVLLVFIL